MSAYIYFQHIDEDFGEVSESVEGARLLSEYTGLNLYRGFKSLPLRQKSKHDGWLQQICDPPFLSSCRVNAPARAYFCAYLRILCRKMPLKKHTCPLKIARQAAFPQAVGIPHGIPIAGTPRISGGCFANLF